MVRQESSITRRQQLHLGNWGGVSLQSRCLRPDDATQEEPTFKTKQAQGGGEVPVTGEQKSSLYLYGMVRLEPNNCNSRQPARELEACAREKAWTRCSQCQHYSRQPEAQQGKCPPTGNRTAGSFTRVLLLTHAKELKYRWMLRRECSLKISR